METCSKCDRSFRMSKVYVGLHPLCPRCRAAMGDEDE